MQGGLHPCHLTRDVSCELHTTDTLLTVIHHPYRSSFHEQNVTRQSVLGDVVHLHHHSQNGHDSLATAVPAPHSRCPLGMRWCLFSRMGSRTGRMSVAALTMFCIPKCRFADRGGENWMLQQFMGANAHTQSSHVYSTVSSPCLQRTVVTP